MAMADHGIPGAWPLGGTDTAASNTAALRAQATSLLAAVRKLNLSRPVAPDENADITKLTAWLKAATEYIHGITGSGIPILPVYQLPAGSKFAVAFEAGAPVGADRPAIMAWLRRIARIRSNSMALHDVLLATEALQVLPADLTAAQLPFDPAGIWAGMPFVAGVAPKVRLAMVFSTPAHIDPAAPICGFICDTWTEQLPGVTTLADGPRGYEAAEITGVAFNADAPDAAAPQAVLLAVAPDAAVGWSLDVLFDTVKETLDLARIRPIDTEDLIRFGRILPAIHSSANLDQTFSNAAQAAGGQ
jgi:hypothetical protein